MPMMNNAIRFSLVAIVVAVVPYLLIYLFMLIGHAAVGRMIAIAFFMLVVIVFLAYQIFFPQEISAEHYAELKVSQALVTKFSSFFRVALLFVLLSFIALEVAPFAKDAYYFSFASEHQIVKGKRFNDGGNMLIDRVLVDDGTDGYQLYHYPYSLERLEPNRAYLFLVLPRSRLVLAAIEG